MYEVIKVNGEWLPAPAGDLSYAPEKIKTESQTEAGTTLVTITRPTKLTISGKWKLSGRWMAKFREYREADTVEVAAYWPSSAELTSYTCQFDYASETLIEKSLHQLGADVGGLYEVSVTMTEL